MKYFFMMLSMIILSAFCGCYSANSLERRPEKKKISTRSSSADSAGKKQNDDDGDPLFNAIFRRNPQHQNSNSILSAEELKMLRQNDVRNNPELRSMHERDRKSGRGNSDWVFGTDNGSYFKKTD